MATGIGSGSQLASEYFKTVAGIEIVHVPYKGTGNALQDLIAGNVQMTIDSMAALLPHIKSGALRALAVTTLERSSNLPEVPTLAETFSGFDASPMNYLSVRGGTPREIIDRINPRSERSAERAGDSRAAARHRRHRDAERAGGDRAAGAKRAGQVEESD